MLDTLGSRVAFPETREVVDTLSPNYTLAIGSTTDTIPLLQDLERNQINISNIFTSELMQVYKPKKDFYTTIISRLGVSASETLFVGDSLLDDIMGPKCVGINTCWINRNGKKSGEIIPDFEVTDLRKLLEIV